MGIITTYSVILFSKKTVVMKLNVKDVHIRNTTGYHKWNHHIENEVTNVRELTQCMTKMWKNL